MNQNLIDNNFEDRQILRIDCENILKHHHECSNRSNKKFYVTQMLTVFRLRFFEDKNSIVHRRRIKQIN